MMRDILIVGSSTLLPPTNNHPTRPPPLSPTSTTRKPYTNKHRSPPKLSHLSSFSRPPLLLNSFDSKSSSNYYGGLASKLAQEGKIEEFLMIAETVLVSDPSSVFVASLNIKLVSLGVSTLISDDRLELVIEFMNRIQKLGISPSLLLDKSVTKLLVFKCRALVKTHKLKEAVDFMETLAGFHFSIKEFVKPSEILKLCVQESDPDTAVRYACMLPNATNLFSSIILEFGKKGDLSSSVIAYEASNYKSDGPNMYACRTMIDVCALCGDFMKSRCIYEGLRAENIIPNTYVYNSLMNVNAHDLSYTLRVFKHMKYLGVVPDLASYNILLKACCRAGRVDLAKNIYEEARHISLMGKLKLDVITYSTIIKVFADAKMWQMALKIKEDMLSAGVTPNVVTWSSLISACANAGLVEEATQIFKEMLLASCEPNSQCCNSLLHACVEACQYDRAFRIFQSWRKSDFQSSCHTINYNSKGQVIQRRENSRESGNMVSFTPTVATFNILMKACGTDYYRAKVLMDEIKIAGLSPNNITWSIFIDICGSTGNVGGSVQALEAMRNNGLKPDVVAYTTAIKACVRNKSLKIAFSLFEEMKRYRVRPNLVTYKTILRARRRYGSVHEVQQCLAIYQDMRKAGYSPNDYFLKELIEEWCEGVITDKSLEKGIVGQSHSHDYIDKETRQSVLLEKVAAHLERDISQSLAVDLRGLTKVEARIVVLAVLRMIKENYTKGDPLEDDIVIILGARNEFTGVVNHKCAVQDAVLKLLQNELGLNVVGPRLPLIRNDAENPLERDLSCRNLEKIGISIDVESSPRRPAMLRRIRVTRKSLYHWLQRRVDIIRK